MRLLGGGVSPLALRIQTRVLSKGMTLAAMSRILALVLQLQRQRPAPAPSTPPPTGSTSPRGSTDVSRPPTTQSGSPINAAKFGLLPKRPVSLLGSQPPSEVKPSQEHSDDDEELEYLENPFEDDNKKR
ncbi:hypothetical protein QCA50_003826 [Cerrena zonata]|uniref:Uncharacterized protein n=1 Tax=Cerrena zonata TaxID=2478898 RepID=A0AAW0GQH2_9APHY